MSALIKCPCGSWTDRVWSDFVYADPRRMERFHFCYFCGDCNDCFTIIPPREAFERNGVRLALTATMSECDSE